MACFRHAEYDEECFGCKVSTIGILAAATPNKKAGVVATNAKQRKQDEDIPAYRRMRADGLQPKSIDGSAVLERHASTKEEVEYGHLLNKSQIKEAVEGMEKAKEITGA